MENLTAEELCQGTNANNFPESSLIFRVASAHHFEQEIFIAHGVYPHTTS